MAYFEKYKPADDLINHLKSLLPSTTDPFIQSRFTGFTAISAVTVYELAIKDIFIEFAKKKHITFGQFTSTYFEKMNGRINLNNLKNDFVKKFGDKYVKKFNINLEKNENVFLRSNINIRSEYGNIIECRNEFVHGNNVTMTFGEVVNAYSNGKEVIKSLAEAMKR